MEWMEDQDCLIIYHEVDTNFIVHSLIYLLQKK